MNEVTKKLRKLVEHRRLSIVVYEQGSIKKYPRNSGSTSYSDYYSSNVEDN